MKKCGRCNETKPLDDFHNSKSLKDGKQSYCKKCTKEYKNKYYLENKGKIMSYVKEYRENNKERITEYRKEYNKKYKEENKDYLREYQKHYVKSKRQSDALFRLKANIRTRTACAFKAKSWRKNSKTEQILGASYEKVMNHIESRFKQGMSWDNLGKWHIDHIIPLSSAENKEELIKLSHYTNLQPLWAEENFVKGDKIIACRIEYKNK